MEKSVEWQSYANKAIYTAAFVILVFAFAIGLQGPLEVSDEQPLPAARLSKDVLPESGRDETSNLAGARIIEYRSNDRDKIYKIIDLSLLEEYSGEEDLVESDFLISGYYYLNKNKYHLLSEESLEVMDWQVSSSTSIISEETGRYQIVEFEINPYIPFSEEISNIVLVCNNKMFNTLNSNYKVYERSGIFNSIVTPGIFETSSIEGRQVLYSPSCEIKETAKRSPFFARFIN